MAAAKKADTTRIFTVAVGLGLVLATAAVAGCGSQQAASPALPTVTITHTVTQSPAPVPTVTVTKTEAAAPREGNGGGAGSGGGANQIITRLNGIGTQHTPLFTTPANWHLSWAYWGCPFRTNFIVYEYNVDGQLSLNGVTINELGTGRGPVATYAYGDGGQHYFSVITAGCHWSLVPVTS